ncbi:MAG: hypothetical protein K0R89_276 [Ramlibacter sp.]|jgi:DNA-binding NarL/FixJ family response regulator|nr:hypothetical protein [Ramlibacter sp.]
MEAPRNVRRSTNKQMKSSRPRLLLVEDHPRIQMQLTEALGNLFDVVAVIPTAAEAVAWMAGHPGGWELAVVDIFLKRGHGFHVLRECAVRRPDQAVVVLSNYTREPARTSALEQGASAVFDKSLEMEEFIAYCVARADVHARAQSRSEQVAA